MVDPNALNSAIENYLDKVDDYIKAHGMDDKRGTEVLDPIQEEVDATLSKVRTHSGRETITSVRLELNRSLERIESALCAIDGQQLAALGNLPKARSASDGGAWAACVTKVTAEIDRVTRRFATLLNNMDDNRRNQYDTNFAAIVDQCNMQMQRSQGDEGAAACTKWALSEIAKVEKQLAALQQQSSAEMLQVLIQEKDAQRLSLLSQGKSVDAKMTNSEKQVINMHNDKALTILNEMANNPTTFDASVRDAKFRLVDKHLANIQRIVQMHAFASDMNGGMFTSQKNLGTIHHRAHLSHKANFVPKRATTLSAPPKNTRAGRMGYGTSSGKSSVDDSKFMVPLGSAEQGFFELRPEEPAKPLAQRTVNTVGILTGIGLLGYMALRRGGQ